MQTHLPIYAALAITALTLMTGNAYALNGFDLSNATVPAKEILRGGPPRDGIFALTEPAMDEDPASDALTADARVLGIEIQGEARAYPIKLLNVHEIVNDRLGSQHYSITFCPLCGTGIAFGTNLGDSALNFGVSGLLYNSDLIMYDRNTESLWSQITGKSIAGKLVETELPRLPVLHTTWQHWRELHPDTELMTPDPRFRRAYAAPAYPGYERSRRLKFPVNQKIPKGLHPKAYVLGISHGSETRAYPFSELVKIASGRTEETIGGSPVVIHYSQRDASAWVESADPKVEWMASFWFAWYAFHPETELWRRAR